MSPSTILRHAAADASLREELLTDPTVYGVPGGAVPDSVEQLDEEALGLWTEGVAAIDAYACSSTCSQGPITIVCDGTTKP